MSLFIVMAEATESSPSSEQGGRLSQAGKLRHDENVLAGGGGAGARRGIRVPDELRGPFDYVTDDAVVVPAVVPALRRQLWEGLERCATRHARLRGHACHCTCKNLIDGVATIFELF